MNSSYAHYVRRCISPTKRRVRLWMRSMPGYSASTRPYKVTSDASASNSNSYEVEAKEVNWLYFELKLYKRPKQRIQEEYISLIVSSNSTRAACRRERCCRSCILEQTRRVVKQISKCTSRIMAENGILPPFLDKAQGWTGTERRLRPAPLH